MKLYKKRIIKSLVFVTIIVLCFSVYGSISKTIPVGHSPQKADSVANAIMNSLGKEVWDTVSYVSWTFRFL